MKELLILVNHLKAFSLISFKVKPLSKNRFIDVATIDRYLIANYADVQPSTRAFGVRHLKAGDSPARLKYIISDKDGFLI